MQDPITTKTVARIWPGEPSEAQVRKLADSGRIPVAARLPDGRRIFERQAVEEAARHVTKDSSHE